ncbi:MAG TPA: hypothetical protein VIK18_07085 [Pirellulales bacterium]
MNLQAVIVCVNYADFLAHTLPENLPLLDYLVVVTTPEDRQTRRLCDSLSVQCVDTREFFHAGDKFNKGRGINYGLMHLRSGGWRLHLDADIVLPPMLRSMLARHPLNESNIYGADRLNVLGFNAWQAVKRKKHEQFHHHCLVSGHDGLATIGSRLVHAELGWCPIGFFQLWHSASGRRYPVNAGAAEHSDVVFAAQWPRENRVKLPEFFVYHLESEKSRMGANWKGRTTRPFGPPHAAAADDKCYWQ